MRQHIRRWFGRAFWLVTVLGLCGWVGGSALPSLTPVDTAGPLCSTAVSVGRTARPGPGQLLAARSMMLSVWSRLSEQTEAADWWVRKSGADHLDEHLPRLREWVEELRR